MGLDASEGAWQVLAPAQRPVNNEQVGIGRYAMFMDCGPCLDRGDHFDVGQARYQTWLARPC